MKKGLILFLACVLCLFAASCRKVPKDSTYKTDLYFINNASEIVAEARDIPYKNVKNGIYTAIMEELLKGPQSPVMKSVIPKGTELLDLSLKDGVLTVNLSREYKFDDSVDEIIARYTIVNTMCSAPSVSKVYITVNGEPLKSPDGTEIKPLSKEDVILSTSKRIQKMNVNLYFSDANARFLKLETRDVLVDENNTAEKVVLTELLKGPTDTASHFKTISKGTKLLSVEVKDGTCFVNFSQEFITKHSGGSAAEVLTIYSVVNSLTDLPNINKVQFLIDGQKVETFKNMIFNEPFARDESLIR